MDFTWTEDQLAFKNAVIKFRSSPLARRRRRRNICPASRTVR